jgi:hypothetical protein
MYGGTGGAGSDRLWGFDFPTRHFRAKNIREGKDDRRQQVHDHKVRNHLG